MAVYIQLEGRVGNNLFQIAAGISLAHKLKIDCYAVWPEKTNTSQYEATIFKKVKFADRVPENCFRYREPDGFSYNEIIVPENKDIVLDGFFQSEKYFNKEVVRNLFTFDTPFFEEIRNKYDDVIRQHPVSLNIRRGDYLLYPKMYPVCTTSYFRDAMKILGKDNVFLITSDDMNWCKRKFKGNNFVFAENNGVLGDLFLQSLCSHNIISNGTFSWWGAWLNENPDKKVIAPNPWFGNVETKDLLPNNWMIVDRKIRLSRYVLYIIAKLTRNM